LLTELLEWLGGGGDTASNQKEAHEELASEQEIREETTPEQK
jgi:hypothetical protein